MKETTGVEEINKVKEYFVNEYPEIFCVEYSFKEMKIEVERIAKYNKKIKDVETLLTSISMEPFTNYEDIEKMIKLYQLHRKSCIINMLLMIPRDLLRSEPKKTIGKMLYPGKKHL